MYMYMCALSEQCMRKLQLPSLAVVQTIIHLTSIVHVCVCSVQAIMMPCVCQYITFLVL